MGQYMEIIKDISAVLGVILSLSAVLSLASQNVRSFFMRIFKKYGKTDEMAKDISELKQLMHQHIEDDAAFKKQVMEMNQTNIEFMQNQCRNTIKDIFYKYKDEKVLPLYEKKTLMYIKNLYVDRMNGNTFAKLLISEMNEWEVDYESSHPGEDGG